MSWKSSWRKKLKELNALHDETGGNVCKDFSAGRTPRPKYGKRNRKRKNAPNGGQTLDFLPGDKLAQFLEIKRSLLGRPAGIEAAWQHYYA